MLILVLILILMLILILISLKEKNCCSSMSHVSRGGSCKPRDFQGDYRTFMEPLGSPDRARGFFKHFILMLILMLMPILMLMLILILMLMPILMLMLMLILMLMFRIRDRRSSNNVVN